MYILFTKLYTFSNKMHISPTKNPKTTENANISPIQIWPQKNEISLTKTIYI